MSRAAKVDVVVVGAGISGLLAARDLAAAGRSVVVLDKGRGVGGRLATRRIGDDARLDHGAQFFTVRTDRFDRLILPLVDDGLVFEWTRGWGDDPDGHPRYAVRGGMTSLAKHLAVGLDVHTSALVSSISGDGHVALDGGGAWQADHVVVTAPVPQTIALLDAGDADVPDGLRRISYDATLVLLVTLDRPSPTMPPSGAAYRRPPFGFIADNARKGLCERPAMTFHLDESMSSERFDRPDEHNHSYLLDAAAPWLDGTTVIESQLKKWRYATPVVLHPEPVLTTGALHFAGDAFGSARVEGAATSGWAAAAAVLRK